MCSDRGVSRASQVQAVVCWSLTCDHDTPSEIEATNDRFWGSGGETGCGGWAGDWCGDGGVWYSL